MVRTILEKVATVWCKLKKCKQKANKKKHKTKKKGSNGGKNKKKIGEKTKTIT